MGSKYAVYIPTTHADVRTAYDEALNGPPEKRAEAAEKLLGTALSLTQVPGSSRYKSTAPMFRAAFNLTKDPEALNLEAREYYESALDALGALEEIASGKSLPNGPSFYVAEVKAFTKEVITIANKILGVSAPGTIKAEVESGQFLNIVLPGVGGTVKVISMPKESVGKDGTFHTSTGATYQQIAVELIEKAEQLAATADAVDFTTPEAAETTKEALGMVKADSKLSSSPKVAGIAGIDPKIIFAALGLGALYLWLRR